MDTTPKASSKRLPISVSTRASRRLRPMAEKRAIVEETLEPGASVAVVARRHEVNANLVFGWRKLYRAGLLTDTAPVPAATLVPVRTKKTARSVKASVPRPCDVAATAIEIVLRNGCVRLPGTVKETLLRALIEALT